MRKSLNNTIPEVCKSYLARFHTEHQKLQPLLTHLESSDNLLSRETLPGHITASGFIFSKNLDRLLMLHHSSLNINLQPGGHLDETETPAEAAIREVMEETGVSAALHEWHIPSGVPFDIDIHTIPTNPRKLEPAHLHYDFRFMLIDPVQRGQGESNAHWVPIEEIEEPNLLRSIAKLQSGVLTKRLCKL